MLTKTLLGYALVASSTALHPDTTADGNADDCWHDAVVGSILKVRDIVDLNDILPPEPERIYLGGTMHALVRREAQLAGTGPHFQWVTVTLTSIPTPAAKLLLLLKHETSGIPTVTYVQVFSRGASPREWRRALSEAQEQRCPNP